MAKATLPSAIRAVNEQGALLVFSIKDKKEVPSLWSYFYPRSEMKWEWDEDGDGRVHDLWFLREKLSSSGKVVYAKWFQNRATLISKELFPNLLRILNPLESRFDTGLSADSLNVYEILQANS